MCCITAPAEGQLHRRARPSERAAAKMVAPRTGTLRASALDLVVEGGNHGVTVWEAHQALGGNLYSLAPRFTELSQAGLIRASKNKARPTNNNVDATVWIATREGVRIWMEID